MNKKILAGLVLGALMMGVAGLAQAQMLEGCTVRADTGIEGCPGAGATCDFDDTDYPCAICCLVGGITFITDWIFAALVLLVIIFVLLGAYNIMTAAGDPGKIEKGRNLILFAGIGLACALFARGVPNLVRYLIGGE